MAAKIQLQTGTHPLTYQDGCMSSECSTPIQECLWIHIDEQNKKTKKKEAERNN
jgi:hypothetical protein